MAIICTGGLQINCRPNSACPNKHLDLSMLGKGLKVGVLSRYGSGSFSSRLNWSSFLEEEKYRTRPYM